MLRNVSAIPQVDVKPRTKFTGSCGKAAAGNDQGTGDLALLGTVAQEHAPTFMAPDRTGKYLLCAYYQGGGAAVYSLGADGAVGAAAQAWLATVHRLTD